VSSTPRGPNELRDRTDLSKRKDTKSRSCRARIRPEYMRRKRRREKVSFETKSREGGEGRWEGRGRELKLTITVRSLTSCKQIQQFSASSSSSLHRLPPVLVVVVAVVQGGRSTSVDSVSSGRRSFASGSRSIFLGRATAARGRTDEEEDEEIGKSPVEVFLGLGGRGSSEWRGRRKGSIDLAVGRRGRREE